MIVRGLPKDFPRTKDFGEVIKAMLAADPALAALVEEARAEADKEQEDYDNAQRG